MQNFAEVEVHNFAFPIDFSAQDLIYTFALMLRCQCLSVCDGSALVHYS